MHLVYPAIAGHPATSNVLRTKLEDIVEALIDLLNDADGDTDLESDSDAEQGSDDDQNENAIAWG